VVQGCTKKCKTLHAFVHAVQEDFEDKYGFGWHVLAGKDFAIDIRYVSCKQNEAENS